MPSENQQLALRVASDFSKARQPLAAALIYAEIAQSGLSTAELWCGLGTSLLQCRGVLVRRPFELWAAKVFLRGQPTFLGTPHEGIVRSHLQELPEAEGSPVLGLEELPSMIDFLLVNERILPEAAFALSPEDRTNAVMVLAERRAPLYIPLLRAAIEGSLGEAPAVAALQRIGSFLDRPEVQASVLNASESPLREVLGPYLSPVMAGIPSGWEAPRTSACPPYLGIGSMEVELSSVSQPEAVVSLLRQLLGASERDAVSWVRFAPCLIRKGAMRDDALRLKTTLGPFAEIKIHHFTWSHQVTPSEVRPPPPPKKPWWKFW